MISRGLIINSSVLFNFLLSFSQCNLSWCSVSLKCVYTFGIRKYMLNPSAIEIRYTSLSGSRSRLLSGLGVYKNPSSHPIFPPLFLFDLLLSVPFSFHTEFYSIFPSSSWPGCPHGLFSSSSIFSILLGNLSSLILLTCP